MTTLQNDIDISTDESNNFETTLGNELFNTKELSTEEETISTETTINTSGKTAHSIVTSTNSAATTTNNAATTTNNAASTTNRFSKYVHPNFETGFCFFLNILFIFFI